MKLKEDGLRQETSHVWNKWKNNPNFYVFSDRRLLLSHDHVITCISVIKKILTFKIIFAILKKYLFYMFNRSYFKDIVLNVKSEEDDVTVTAVYCNHHQYGAVLL